MVIPFTATLVSSEGLAPSKDRVLSPKAVLGSLLSHDDKSAGDTTRTRMRFPPAGSKPAVYAFHHTGYKMVARHGNSPRSSVCKTEASI
jgi:hypothetical protein